MSFELDIINAMLAVNGESPVSAVDSNDPAAIQARNALKRVDKKIQSRGWWYNKETFTLTPQSGTGEVVLPSNVMSVDPTDTRSPYVQRGTRLYDRENNTFVIGKSVEVDLMLQLSVEDLPATAFNYLMDKAVQEYYVDEDGDAGKARELRDRVNESYAFLHREDLRNKDVNIRTSETGIRLLQETSRGRRLRLRRDGS